MVAFVEVPFNLVQFFHDGVPQVLFLDAVLVFMRPGPSVCDKPQAVVAHTRTNPKFDSSEVVVLVQQILHETGFVSGTYHKNYFKQHAKY
jgi:hypothetical protein